VFGAQKQDGAAIAVHARACGQGGESPALTGLTLQARPQLLAEKSVR
jgi:tRNA-dihydrouridine synthase